MTTSSAGYPLMHHPSALAFPRVSHNLAQMTGLAVAAALRRHTHRPYLVPRRMNALLRMRSFSDLTRTFLAASSSYLDLPGGA